MRENVLNSARENIDNDSFWKSESQWQGLMTKSIYCIVSNVFVLKQERRLLKQLEEERLAAEKAMKAVQEKLAAAEQASKTAAEQAKKKARELKTAVGLARTVGPAVPSWVSHRGPGAFCEGDFDAKPLAEKSERKGLEKSDENGKGEESRTDGDQDKSQQETAAAAEKIEANGAIEAKAEENGVHEGQKTSEEVAASE